VACSKTSKNEFTAVVSCCIAAGHLSRSLISAVCICTDLIVAINLIASSTIPVGAAVLACKMGGVDWWIAGQTGTNGVGHFGHSCF